MKYKNNCHQGTFFYYHLYLMFLNLYLNTNYTTQPLLFSKKKILLSVNYNLLQIIGTLNDNKFDFTCLLHVKL